MAASLEAPPADDNGPPGDTLEQARSAKTALAKLRSARVQAEKTASRIRRDYANRRELASARRVLGFEPDEVAATGLEDLLTGDSDLLWLQATPPVTS